MERPCSCCQDMPAMFQPWKEPCLFCLPYMKREPACTSLFSFLLLSHNRYSIVYRITRLDYSMLAQLRY